LETVIENRTGLFFKEPTVEDISEAVECFEQRASSFDENDLIANARRFNKSIFLEKFKSFVDGGENRSPDLSHPDLKIHSSEFSRLMK